MTNTTEAKPVVIFAATFQQARTVARMLGLPMNECAFGNDRARCMGVNPTAYRIVEVPGWEGCTAVRDCRAVWRERETRFGKSEVIPCPT